MSNLWKEWKKIVEKTFQFFPKTNRDITFLKLSIKKGDKYNRIYLLIDK